jgi:sec-independent protein translocase protein TatA
VLVILFFALMMFGGRLPEVAKSLGRSVNQFKRGLKDLNDEVQAADAPKYVPPRALPPAGVAPPSVAPPSMAAEVAAPPRPPLVAASTEAARGDQSNDHGGEPKASAPAQG